MNEIHHKKLFDVIKSLSNTNYNWIEPLINNFIYSNRQNFTENTLELILDYFKLVTGISARTLSWSWLMTKFIEKDEDLVTEEISDINKVKAMDMVLQNEYPNQYTDEHAGSTLVLTDEENAYILFKYNWKKNTLYYDFDLIYKPFDKWLPFDDFEYSTSFNNLLRDYSEFRFGKRPEFVHSITA